MLLLALFDFLYAHVCSRVSSFQILKTGTRAVFGCADGSLFFFDYAAGGSCTPQLVSRHEAGVRCIEYIPQLSIVACSGWDASLKFYDLQSSAPLKTFPLPDKAFAMSYNAGQLVIATAGGSVTIVDIPQLAQGADPSVCFSLRESPLKGTQARAVLVLPGAIGYAICGAEGKVAVEPILDPAATGLKPFSFKCHRRTSEGVEEAFPVHSACLHPLGTVATGGADGSVAVWDLTAQKRVSLVSGYPAGVTAVAFSGDGATMAVTCGDVLAEVTNGGPPANGVIYLRGVSEVDVRPRGKA